MYSEVNYPDLTSVYGHHSSSSFIPQYQTSPGNRPPCQYDWVVCAFVNQQEQHRQLSLQAVTRHVSWFFNYCLECNSLTIIPSSSLDQGLSLKGRSVVEDRFCTLLPTANIDVLTTSQHQLQSLLDSTMWHSIKDNTSLRDRA